MWHSFFRRIRLDWVQIEVSSVCNASCCYCPQTAYKDVWKKLFFDHELIRKIVPFLHPKTYIHLQGWGEPFTHPRLFAMIEDLKRHGFTVGTTTNGSLLTPEHMQRLIDVGLDLIAFSTAGCSSEKNDLIRHGTSLKQVISCIETLNRLKAARKSPYPRIHLAHMLLRSGLSDIESCSSFWRDLGVDHIVLSSLSLITRPDLQKEAILADSIREWDELKQRLNRIRLDSGLQNILHFHLVSPFMIFKRCSENISKSTVIGADGAVSSCVMANIPVTKPVPYWSYGKRRLLTRTYWADSQQQDLHHIWKDKQYKSFRKQETFSEGPCDNCLKRCIEISDTEYSVDSSSFHSCWQLLREASEEKEALRRRAAKN
ncbi:MAG: hypothetical protein CSA26_09400 [Desulfobacterales bacterium]|nr:MAG: hypothetical protein CSA26_09400 [Desulfobacterales bacterium]